MAHTLLLAFCSCITIILTLSGCGGTYDPNGKLTTQEISSTTLPTPSTDASTESSTAPWTTTTTTSSRTIPTSTTTTTTTTTTAGPACPYYNGTHGCYAGEVVDLSVMFVCGPNEASGAPAVYPYSTTSCCAQGIRFNPSTQMCCYDGVHNIADGFCAPWWDDFPTQCYCPYNFKSTPIVTLSSADHIVVDTRIRPSNPCHYAGSQAGCYNGYEFDYSQQMPCGTFIIDINTHGCCPTGNAFSPYNFQTESCCHSEDHYEVNQGPHTCTCRRYGCDGASEMSSVLI